MAEDVKNEEVKAPELQPVPEASKFTDEELESLQSLQTKYQEKQAQLGQLAVQRIIASQQSEAIETRMIELEGEYSAVQQEERDLVTKLNKKYGPGQLNPETGVFTPTT
tara:strand:+ start:245 stop:571 length:327 start_codon:yes stop_codon:yes gene_type:complete